MKVEVRPVRYQEKSVLNQLLELYGYEFSEYVEMDLNEHGYFGYPFMDHYWTESGRHPYFIRVDGQLGGFVLINQESQYYKGDPGVHAVAEFFVLRRYQGRGVGEAAARLIFDRHPGKWEVLQLPSNLPAQKFWSTTISRYLKEKSFLESFSEIKTEDWVGYLFDNLT